MGALPADIQADLETGRFGSRSQRTSSVIPAVTMNVANVIITSGAQHLPESTRRARAVRRAAAFDARWNPRWVHRAHMIAGAPTTDR
jgi:hypothetical protein